MNTTDRQELEELEERFEAWCALRGADPALVGAWEQFEREQG